MNNYAKFQSNWIINIKKSYESKTVKTIQFHKKFNNKILYVHRTCFWVDFLQICLYLPLLKKQNFGCKDFLLKIIRL